MENNILRPLLFGDEILKRLQHLPQKIDVEHSSSSERLQALNDLYDLFIPHDQMSVEIYMKLHLMASRSLDKKNSLEAIRQSNLNRRYLTEGTYPETLSTGTSSDASMTIIGPSGIGKSSNIGRVISLIAPDVVTIEKPYRKIIPFLLIQIPFDSNPKSLFTEIAREIDRKIGTNYLASANRVTMSTSRLLSMASSMLLNHVLCLVLDETQNLIINKTGKFFVNLLTQLINSSRVGIVLVGTEDTSSLFASSPFLQRRTFGLQYYLLSYEDVYFRHFCETLFEYQYTLNKITLNEAMLSFIYQISNGSIAIITSLFIQANEMAILNGSERIDLPLLKEAALRRMGVLFENLKVNKSHTQKPNNDKEFEIPEDSIDLEVTPLPDNFMVQIANEAKSSDTDAVQLLQGNIPIIEINLQDNEEENV
jgi:hypothetical protein